MGLLLVILISCKSTVLVRDADKSVPPSYAGASQDSTTIGSLSWKEYFKDTCLTKLIDSALVNNQELNITLMELAIANNEIMAKKGEYLPFLDVKAGAGADKVGRYTTHGAMEATTEMEPGKAIPELVPDFQLGAFARWEVDIWGKLRNARKAAAKRYLASVEGRNFMITQLVAEIADSYFELEALDKQLDILDQNIEIQENALKIVRLEKSSARVTELAVRKFEAEVYYTKSLRYAIRQQITETENRINFLVGRFPQKVERNPSTFDVQIAEGAQTGIPSQLLDLRTDVKQAELELEAAKLDVDVAKANFYPSLGLKGGVGLNAFKPTYIIRPESILFSLAGDLVGPVINRNAIKAQYNNAGAKQVQAVFNYERTVLNAVVEVSNQLNKINNLQQAYQLKNQQVNSLTEAIKVSNDLFASARADYMEVLMTQRDVVESRFELIETKKQQFQARINIYRALGGGWK